jgi:hypothetical protein
MKRTILLSAVFGLVGLPFACAQSTAGDVTSPEETTLTEARQSALEAAAGRSWAGVPSIESGSVTVATFGCAPRCEGSGTKSEGWYDGCSGMLVRLDACKGHAAFCDHPGTSRAGWYSTSGALIAHARCEQPRGRNGFDVRSFEGARGQLVDLYADGLLQRSEPRLDGLDTYVFLFAETVSGRLDLVAWNDDTNDPTWTVRSNLVPNPRSASIHASLPSDGTYYLVVGRHDQQQGSAELAVKLRDPKSCGVVRFFFDEYAPVVNFFYVVNVPPVFATKAEAEEWARGLADNARLTWTDGPCTPPDACAQLVEPVCGSLVNEPPKTWGNSCELESMMLSAAGTDGYAKGSSVDGECPETYCGAAQIIGGDQVSRLYYAENFASREEADEFAWGQPDTEDGRSFLAPCSKVTQKCAPGDEAICGVWLYDPEKTYACAAELRQVIRDAAGTEGRSKGYWVPNACVVPTRLCAVATFEAEGSKPPASRFVYAANFASQAEADVWFQNFPAHAKTSTSDGTCSTPTSCIQVYDPVCGELITESEARTFPNDCVFVRAVRQGAGDTSESKGFYTQGACGG